MLDRIGREAVCAQACDRFVAACRVTVSDEQLRGRPLIGSIDQFCDSTDVLSEPLTTVDLSATRVGPRLPVGQEARLQGPVRDR
jgi:hypothetical protein